MQPTPLRGPQIVAFLKAGIGPMVFLVYAAARLMGRPLGVIYSSFETYGYQEPLNRLGRCHPNLTASGRGITMGPFFNPIYWFFGLIICVVALIVAALAGVLVHQIRLRRYSRLPKRAQPPHWFTSVILAATFGIVTFCGLGTRVFRDPSVPLFPPNRESIIGVWEPDAYSLSTMERDGGYVISTHTITFREDSSFEMINMPDWWLNDWHESTRGFYSGSGTWKIEYFHDYWVVWLNFSKLNGYPDGLGTYLTIGDWNGQRSIYYRLSETDIVTYKKR